MPPSAVRAAAYRDHGYLRTGRICPRGEIPLYFFAGRRPWSSASGTAGVPCPIDISICGHIETRPPVSASQVLFGGRYSASAVVLAPPCGRPICHAPTISKHGPSGKWRLEQWLTAIRHKARWNAKPFPERPALRCRNRGPLHHDDWPGSRTGASAAFTQRPVIAAA